MEVEKVREFLGLSREEIYQRTAQAAQGGILKVHSDQVLSVEPEPLRSALVGEVFFSPPSLPYKSLLSRASAGESAVVETLVEAAWRGAKVPRDELRDLLEASGSLRAWQGYSLLGESEAQWTADYYPGPLEDVAGVLFSRAPRTAIKRLLQQPVAKTEGSLHSQSQHPLRLIQDWVRDIPDPRHVEG